MLGKKIKKLDLKICCFKEENNLSLFATWHAEMTHIIT